MILKSFYGIFKILMILFVLVFCFYTGATYSAVEDFSADMISRHGRQTANYKIYVSDGRVRLESDEELIILRPDKNLTWIIMPSERMYIEQQISQEMMSQTAGSIEEEIERELLGRENIDGEEAEKFKVKYYQDGNVATVYQWLNASGIPVKLEAVDGSWSIEYKNIQIGVQPDSLFEPPEGFQKMSFPGMGF